MRNGFQWRQDGGFELHSSGDPGTTIVELEPSAWPAGLAVGRLQIEVETKAVANPMAWRRPQVGAGVLRWRALLAGFALDRKEPAWVENAKGRCEDQAPATKVEPASGRIQLEFDTPGGDAEVAGHIRIWLTGKR